MGVGLGVVSATSEPPVHAIGTRLGVCPEHTDRWIDIQLKRSVTFLLRGYDPVAEEVEVVEIASGSGCARAVAGGSPATRRKPRTLATARRVRCMRKPFSSGATVDRRYLTGRSSETRGATTSQPGSNTDADRRGMAMTRARTIALIVFVVLVAACGDDGDTATTTGGTGGDTATTTGTGATPPRLQPPGARLPAPSQSGIRTTPRRSSGPRPRSRPGMQIIRTRRSPQEIPAGETSEAVIAASITAATRRA